MPPNTAAPKDAFSWSDPVNTAQHTGTAGAAATDAPAQPNTKHADSESALLSVCPGHPLLTHIAVA